MNMFDLKKNLSDYAEQPPQPETPIEALNPAVSSPIATLRRICEKYNIPFQVEPNGEVQISAAAYDAAEIFRFYPYIKDVTANQKRRDVSEFAQALLAVVDGKVKIVDVPDPVTRMHRTPVAGELTFWDKRTIFFKDMIRPPQDPNFTEHNQQLYDAAKLCEPALETRRANENPDNKLLSVWDRKK